MAQQSTAASPPQRLSVGRIAWFLFVLVSFGLLFFLLVSEFMRFSTPAQLHRLQIVQDIPLPDALPDAHRTSLNPFAAGQAQRFDHFDFQSFDPTTHLLFSVHTGPNPDKEAAILHNLNFDAGTDGNVVVFNTALHKVVGLIDVPLGAGILVAPDIGKVFIGDANDSIVYIANEQSPFNVIAKVQHRISVKPTFSDFRSSEGIISFLSVYGNNILSNQVPRGGAKAMVRSRSVTLNR